MIGTVNHGTSYSSSRRNLGICYVGFMVVLASVLLALGSPARSFGSTDLSTAQWFKNILLFTFAYEVIGLPFDLSGFFIERAFRKTIQPAATYLYQWCKSAFKHGMLLISSIFFFTVAAKFGGIIGVIVSSFLVSVFSVWKQAEIARFLSNIQFEEQSQEMRGTYVQNRNGTIGLIMARSSDSGFTGGVIGLPRAESLVIPTNWLEDLSQQELWAEITRRNAAIECGSRTRGVTGAILFIVAGVAITSSITDFYYHLTLDSAAGVVTASLLFTVWSFLGLLTLPVWNQRGVIEADKAALDKGVNRTLLSQTIEKIDAKMENECKRSDAVQFVFHPIPTPGRRREALDQRTTSGAWHIARYAIWLSLAGLGLLGRAVHCNAGRPDLWCMLPAD